MLLIVIVQNINFFVVTNDQSIGKVKEEILPFDTQDRILAYLVSLEGSTTSSGRGGEGEGNKQSKHLHHHQDDTILTLTINTNSTDYQKYFAKQRAGIEVISFPSNDLESTTFLDETEDDRYSTVTDSTTISSRYHSRNRPRGRIHQLQSGLDRASPFSSLNSDSTMTSNIITVTLNLGMYLFYHSLCKLTECFYQTQLTFLGVTIVDQIDETDSSDGRLYVKSIMKRGAVAQDGRIAPGDMILQVNDINLKGLSHDDVTEILREAVQKLGTWIFTSLCW
ncbi:unnamed protein product [Rotaria sordida]|uniref:PDZ domain-containing protein n=1 Tax=Rotaria sordida TaxID=392033 RepID=A0A814WAC5_9BILA|nr:unnamed protein product [Rotaria sordida]CAF3552586.1 unnamed protein product [Rotaria sordida]